MHASIAQEEERVRVLEAESVSRQTSSNPHKASNGDPEPLSGPTEEAVADELSRLVRVSRLRPLYFLNPIALVSKS